MSKIQNRKKDSGKDTMWHGGTLWYSQKYIDAHLNKEGSKLKEETLTMTNDLIDKGFGGIAEMIGEARKELDKYDEENKKLKSSFDSAGDTIAMLNKELLRFEKENKKLRECVEFYALADMNSWIPAMEITGRQMSAIILDDTENIKGFLYGGKRARQTLQELNDK